MKITIYTIPDCPFCKQAKDFLTSKGLPFDEKDVLNNKDALAEMLQKSQNFAGVPFTIVEEGATSSLLKGFTQSEFEDALNKASGMPVSDQEGALSAPAMSPAPTAPADMPLPVTPAMPSSMVNSQPLNTVPVEMPKPAGLDMPTIDVAPAGTAPSVAPTDVASDDPQEELNSLLEDLQTKVDTIEPMGAPTSGMPATPSQSAPSASTTTTSQDAIAPQNPLGGQTSMQSGFNGNAMPAMPVAADAPAPSMPDFSQKQ